MTERPLPRTSPPPEPPATTVLREHGAEIFGFLVRSHGAADAEEIYGLFVDALVKSDTTYRGEVSPRTWGYLLARSAARRYARSRARARALFSPMAHHPSALERPVTGPERSALAASEVTAIDASLSPEERELLVLRLGRGFRFSEIALILGEVEDGDPADERVRAAARLRKRFQELRDRIRAARTS